MNVKTKLSDHLHPLLLSTALLATTTQTQIHPLNHIVAIIDNDVIMQNQLNTHLHEVQQTIDKHSGTLPPKNVLNQQMLEHLIIKNIQLQINEHSDIHITNKELNQTMDTITERNNMNLKQFRETLAHDNLSYTNAHDQIHREMIINHVRQHRVAERIQITDQHNFSIIYR